MIQYIDTSWTDAEVSGWTGPGWYFWDETYHCNGPYDNEADAYAGLTNYVRKLNGPG